MVLGVHETGQYPVAGPVADDLLLKVGSELAEGEAQLVLRPERLRLLSRDQQADSWDNALTGEVAFAAFDGTGVFVQVRLNAGFTVSVHTTMRDNLDVEIGDEVTVVWNASEASVVPLDEHQADQRQHGER